jgi:hypothetical protein
LSLYKEVPSNFQWTLPPIWGYLKITPSRETSTSFKKEHYYECYAAIVSKLGDMILKWLLKERVSLSFLSRDEAEKHVLM